MKIKILLLTLLAVIVIVGTIVFSARSADTVKIGGLYPLTGGLASYGEPALRSAQIAVDDINEAGGISGKKFELIAEDHRCDPKAAVSAFEKLASADNIHIFTSAACTGTVVALVPGLDAKDAVLLGTITSGNKLTGISPRFFRNWASDGLEARLLADEIINKGYKNIAVIYEETDYAKGLKISLDEYLKGANVKISGESFVSGAADVRSQLTKLAALNPDLIFISVQTVPSGELVLTQMEQLKFRPKAMLVNDNILKAAPLLKNHGSLLEGAVGGDYVFPQTERLDVILAKYKAKYGSDCPQINICGAEYDAIMLLGQAIEAKGGSAEGVRDFLQHASYDGVSGNIAFDSQNDRSNAKYSLFTIKSGQAQLLK